MAPATCTHQALHPPRQLLKWHAQIEAVGGCGAFQHAPQKARGASRAQRPLQQRPGAVHDHLGRIELVARPESFAFRTGAVGRIEAEAARLERGERKAAVGAGQPFGEHLLGTANDGHRHQSAGQPQRGRDRFAQPRLAARAHHQPIHDDLDGVRPAAIEAGWFVQAHQLAVDSCANEAALRVLFQLAPVFSLAPADDRRQDHDAFACGGLPDGLDDLIHRLAPDRAAALRAVRRADGAVEHAQIVVDFRHRADGGTRRARRGLLLDGNGGR